MKFNFKNLAKLFLAGACFAAVGCTDYAEDIQNLNNRIDALETETIAPLQADLKKVQEDLAAAQTAIEAQKAKHTEDINALNEQIAALDKEIDTKVSKSEFEGVKADLEAKLALCATKAELEAEVATLNAKDAELAGLIEALDARLKANETLAAKNAEDIKTNAALFEEYKKATNETLALMQEAHAALEIRVGSLETDLAAYKAAIRAELDEHYAAFSAYTKKTDEAIAALQADLEAQKERISANESAIGVIKMQITNIQAELEALYNEMLAKEQALKDLISENASQIAVIKMQITNIQAELEALYGEMVAKEEALKEADKQLQDNIDSLDAKVEGYKKATDEAIAALEAKDLEQDGRILANEIAIGVLKSQVVDLQSTIDALDADLRGLIAELDKRLSGQLDALKARIQSIVFVPEYTDGKATIEYAMFGNKIIECNSVLRYQIHPAECAGAVKPEDLSFLFEELKTRAGAQFVVKGVKVADATKGHIDVTVQAQNLQDDFYRNEINYAVSLVFTHNSAEAGVSNNIASCYTQLIPESDRDVAQISMGILNKEGKEIFDPQAQPVESHEIIYSDLETKKEFMPGNYPVFKLGNGIWFTYEQITNAGYQISEPVQNISYNYYDKNGVETDAFKSVYKNVEDGEGYKYVTASLAKVEKLAVKSYETVTYSYTTDGNNVSTTGKVTIIKDQGTFEIGEATINWKRDADNLKPHFFRESIELTLPEPVKQTTYAEAVAGDLTKLTVNGEDILNNTWDATDDKISAELVKVAADAKTPLLNFEGFEWNKTYTFVALYELDNIDMTINFVVKTVRPEYEITLEPWTINWNYAQDWKSTFGQEDTNRVLEAVTAETKTNIEGNTVPAYADVVKNGLQNNNESPAPEYEYTETGINFTKFEWNKEYPYEVEFALEDALVTVKSNITTVKDIKNITVTLPESTQDILPNLVINETDHAINDDLVAAFNLPENAAALDALCLGTTTVQDYLTAIFADATLPQATEVSNKRTTDTKATVFDNVTDNTKLLVNADGLSSNTYFSYVDYSPIPNSVIYKLVVKTWYDIEIEFVKTVEFELNTNNQYEYNRVRDFVFESEGLFFSNAIPYYFNSPTYSTFMSDIQVELNMYTAFNIIDANGENMILDPTSGRYGKGTPGTPEFVDYGLVSTFYISNKYAPVGSGVKFNGNTLRYHDVDKAVGVRAKLELYNTDGTLAATIPTKFSEVSKNGEKGEYYDYEVRQYDPIQQSVLTGVDPYIIQFDVKKDAKTYINYVMNGFQLLDKRDNGYNLVEQGQKIDSTETGYNANVEEWRPGHWLVGDETNMYATGVHVDQIYGLKIVEMKYASKEDENKVKDMIATGALEFDPGTGKITFRNGNQLQLTESVSFNISVLINYTWGTRKFNVTVNLNKMY